MLPPKKNNIETFIYLQHVHTPFMELIAHKNAIQLVKTRNVITKPENALKSNRYFIKRY